MAITKLGKEISKYSKYVLVDGVKTKVTYYFKDAAAREAISAGMDRKVVTELPTASADTMGSIYMMPATREGQTKNIYKEYITIKSTDATPVYSWEQIGDTEVDLTDYSKNDHHHTVTAAGTNAASDVTFEDNADNKATVVTGLGTATKDEVLGSGTSFTNAASDVTFADNTNNKASVATVSAAGSVTAGADAELDGGKVASFTQGTDSFTQGAKASFTQGAKASFTQGSKASLDMTVNEDDEELVIDFTPNGDDSFTANGDDTFVANGDDTFTQGSDSFTANELQSIKEGTGKATQVTLPTFGSADVVKIGATGSAAAQSITVGAEDKVEVVKELGTATTADVVKIGAKGSAAAQTFTGSEVSTSEAIAKA